MHTGKENGRLSSLCRLCASWPEGIPDPSPPGTDGLAGQGSGEGIPDTAPKPGDLHLGEVRMVVCQVRRCPATPAANAPSAW
jgi:hypothetical protein